MKKRDKFIAFLGRETEFEGKLTFSGTIRIDGHFRGEILAEGNLLVGEDGIVEANIHISNIVINGEVHGNIIADQRVDIRAPGKVFGDILAPVIVMEEGVLFEGNCRMHQVEKIDNRVNIYVTAEAPGVIQAPDVVVNAGVFLEEKTQMSEADEDDERGGRG